jgi:serine-type D-Ala-D-Ala carboxypeptidase (penicillin-binding protein 5/6)
VRAAAGLTALFATCSLAASAKAAPPVVDARAWLIENPATGEVLASHDDRYQAPIASITKLMTVIVALQHLKLSDLVQVDPRAAHVGQEAIPLSSGQEITVHDLVKGALIQSANNAADALALATAPSFPAFAELMNAKARELGLTDSNFVRPDGLDAPGEHSSARDVTRLAEDAMKIPIVRATVAEQTDTIADGSVLHTWNDLLGVVPGVFGVKTGHTSAAGWGQVAAVRGDGTTLFVTILGSPSRSRRNADLERLLAYGLAQYRQVDAVATGRNYAEVQLPYGNAPLVLVARARLDTVVRLGGLLTQRVVAPASAALPIRKGQIVGQIQIYAGARLIGERPLVASRSVAKPGLPTRVGWYARRTVHNLVSLLS